MPASIKSTTRSEDAVIMKRLLACMPASRYEMQTLCRLAGIETTRSLPTAAVECKRRPRLLINPDFVAQYCQRDEHLFLLVMHELWHVLLAHTRMYPRMTPAQNIAFDAIINAELMSEFAAPEYRGFFEATNAADKFPHCLLRPPVGWPDNPQYPENVGPPGTREILMRLYPIYNQRLHSAPLYEEILNLLLKSGMCFMVDRPLLLGNHDSSPIHDPILKNIMQQISEKWPTVPFVGDGDHLRGQRMAISPSTENMRRVFSQVLKACLGQRPGAEQRRARMPVPATGGIGVLPNGRDRLAPARRRLGAPSMLWMQQGTVRARVPEKPSRAFVYLDVSGSMNAVLPHMLGLLLPYVLNGKAAVYQFSTLVTDLSIADLKRGHLTTTLGTNINCVLNHVLRAEQKVERVLLLTDGEVGYPLPHLCQQAGERNIKLHVVMPDRGTLNPRVKDMATSVVILPPVR